MAVHSGLFDIGDTDMNRTVVFVLEVQRFCSVTSLKNTVAALDKFLGDCVTDDSVVFRYEDAVLISLQYKHLSRNPRTVYKRDGSDGSVANGSDVPLVRDPASILETVTVLPVRYPNHVLG